MLPTLFQRWTDKIAAIQILLYFKFAAKVLTPQMTHVMLSVSAYNLLNT